MIVLLHASSPDCGKLQRLFFTMYEYFTDCALDVEVAISAKAVATTYL